jgi:uncharacterized protein (UPF0179 family)
MVVTLVGETQAKVGTTFIFRGPIPECRDCNRKTVCFNLEEGTLYEIIDVREKHHECNVHERGVRVVELKKSPIITTLDSKFAIEGSTVSLEKAECLNMGCESRRLCYSFGPNSKKKYKVIKVNEDVVCPEGRKLRAVMIAE